jgi:uncharacterized protein YqeY
MRDKILEDLKEAMKAQDKETLSVIRMVKGAMQMKELDKHAPLTDEEVIGVIAKEIKTRKESIVEFEKGNRTDLIEKTNKEIEILNKYMPEELSEEEVAKIIDEAFNTLKPTASDMGKVMGYITPKVKGKADLSSISKIVKERLGNL